MPHPGGRPTELTPQVLEDVRRPFRVADATVVVHHVAVVCAAVLGYVKRGQVRILAPEADEQAAKPIRIDLPVHRCARQGTPREGHILRADERG